jgi:hypothetical protein
MPRIIMANLDRARGERVHPGGGVELSRRSGAVEPGRAGAEVEVNTNASVNDHRNKLEDDTGDHNVGAGVRGVGVVACTPPRQRMSALVAAHQAEVVT